jgi:hypothetical protein
VIGTYLHGPVLVRNPAFADLILSWFTGPLEPLDDGRVDLLRKERLRAPETKLPRLLRRMADGRRSVMEPRTPKSRRAAGRCADPPAPESAGISLNPHQPFSRKSSAA